MGKSFLIVTCIALTLLSLISVESSDKIAKPTICLKRFDFNVNYLTRCDPKSFLSGPPLDASYSAQQARVCIALIARLFVFVYCCLSIGSLCDKHFVPSLGSIGKSLSLSPEITGSILIPLGTSGPEIFSSAVGILLADNDIGTGAIIGSSCYNQLAIPAVCGMAVVYFVGKPIQLDAQPILRDLMFYIIAIIGLIFTVKDNNVDIVDSSLLMVLFALYIGVKLSENSPNIDKNNNSDTSKYLDKIEDEIEDDDNDSCLFDNSIVNLLLMPVTMIFELTMASTKSPIIPFLMSICWLSILSYLCVFTITDISISLSIPSTIAGMTLLAAGSAVPDLVTSVVVIRKTGKASLGICSAISANIFAILIGLGLPWLIKCIINSYAGDKPSFTLPSNSLPFTAVLLLIAIFAMIIALKLSKWQLFKKLAIICGIIHIVFTGLSISIEYFMFNY